MYDNQLVVLLFIDKIRYFVYHKEVPNSLNTFSQISSVFFQVVAPGCFYKFVCLCLSESVYVWGIFHCLLSVSRLPITLRRLRDANHPPPSLFRSLSLFYFSFFLSMFLCLVFEPLPVTVNLRQPLCWHRWEVNRSK